MLLLKDIYFYAIKVDYFMYNSETDEEYTEPVYLSINTEIKDKEGNPMYLISFKEEITENIRIFDTESEAKTYIRFHIMNNNCFENQRVVKIQYNFETNKWEEA